MDQGIGCDAEGMCQWHSSFDLLNFDDCEFETRTPNEWVPKKSSSLPPSAKAAKLCGDGSWLWQDCIVHEYDHENNSCLVQYIGENESDWLPRVCVCFKAEDPEVFSQRVAAAFKERRRAEAQIKWVMNGFEMCAIDTGSHPMCEQTLNF